MPEPDTAGLDGFMVNVRIGNVVSIVSEAVGNLRALRILLGDVKIESAVRYLGVDGENAVELAERRTSDWLTLPMIGRSDGP